MGGDFAAGQTLNPPKHDGFAAARRQAVQSGVEPLQFVASNHVPIRSGLVGGYLSEIGIGDASDGGDFSPAEAIHQNIACNGEYERSCRLRKPFLRALVNPQIDLLPQIVDIATYMAVPS